MVKIKKPILVVLIVIATGISIGGVAWYYFGQIRTTRIEKILSNPMEYKGKVVSVEGEVTDRTSFFVVLKFYKVRDKTGEIIAVTKKSLPEIKSKVFIKGRIDDAFPIGEQRLVIFVEESVEEKGKNK